MTLTNCSADTSVVRDLPDEPAITAAELKAAFDGAADNIKTWLNSIHLPELDGELSGKEDSLSLTASSAVFADSDGAAVSKSYAEARQLLGLGNTVGVLGIAYGGTGQTDADGAMAALCEAGTFAPILKGADTAGSPVYQVHNGRYYRMGDYVYVNMHIVTSSLGNAAGDVIITDLPFACVVDDNILVTMSFSGNTQGYASLNNGTMYGGNIYLYCTSGNGQYNGCLKFTGMDAVSEIQASVMYKIAE